MYLPTELNWLNLKPRWNSWDGKWCGPQGHHPDLSHPAASQWCPVWVLPWVVLRRRHHPRSWGHHCWKRPSGNWKGWRSRRNGHCPGQTLMGKQGSWVGMLPEEWRWACGSLCGCYLRNGGEHVALCVCVTWGMEVSMWLFVCVLPEEWRWACGSLCGCYLRNGGEHVALCVCVTWGMEVSMWFCVGVTWGIVSLCGCYLRNGGEHVALCVGVTWGMEVSMWLFVCVLPEEWRWACGSLSVTWGMEVSATCGGIAWGMEVSSWLCVGVFWGTEVGTCLCMWVLLEEWRRALGFGVLPEKWRCVWVVFEICIPGEGVVCDVIGGLVTCKIQGKHSSRGGGWSGRRPCSVLRPNANVSGPVSVAAATRRMRVEERNRMVSARRPMITTLSTSRVRKSLKRKKMKQ